MPAPPATKRSPRTYGCGGFAVPLPCRLASGQNAGMDLSKPAPPSGPQSYKGHMATATVLPDRVVFKRSPLARLGGNRSGEVPLSDVVALNVVEPTGWVNGHVHLQSAADRGPVGVSSAAGNPRTILFRIGQLDAFKGFVAAVQQAWGASSSGL